MSASRSGRGARLRAGISRFEAGARRAPRVILAAIGTPPVSLALLALAAGYLAAWWTWARLGSEAGAGALIASWAFDALAAALVVDAGVALARVAPLELTPEGRVRFAWGRARLGSVLVQAGYALVALGFVASLLTHDRFGLRVAVGEEFVSAPGQIVERAPPRSMSPGPFPVAFTLAETEVAFDREGVASGPRATLALPDGGRVHVGTWWPRWQGWGRFLLAHDAGLTLRFESRAPRGRRRTRPSPGSTSSRWGGWTPSGRGDAAPAVRRARRRAGEPAPRGPGGPRRGVPGQAPRRRGRRLTGRRARVRGIHPPFPRGPQLGGALDAP